MGLATAEDLRVGQLNIGLSTAQHFSKDGKIHEHLQAAASRIRVMAEHVHVVALNEVHPAFHEELDQNLRNASEKLSMVAAECGDVLVWCHATRSSRL